MCIPKDNLNKRGIGHEWEGVGGSGVPGLQTHHLIRVNICAKFFENSSINGQAVIENVTILIDVLWR